MTEQAVQFDCHGATLVGILHKPAQPKHRGIVVIVGGGPQYRAGGHRQLVLWSRRMCEAGYPVLRFDYRGMGDSSGTFPTFEHIDDDIRAATDALARFVPEVNDVVLWGECDASSAILFCAWRDPRVHGAVLLNPWARTENIRARAVLKHYYLKRLLEPSFWRKLLTGGLNPLAALREVIAIVQRSRASLGGGAAASQTAQANAPLSREMPLPERLLAGLQRFNGRIMLVMSGRDLIAREFDELLKGSPAWQAEVARKDIERHDLPDGDHTFSSAVQRNQVIAWGLDWLKAGEQAAPAAGARR